MSTIESLQKILVSGDENGIHSEKEFYIRENLKNIKWFLYCKKYMTTVWKH